MFDCHCRRRIQSTRPSVSVQPGNRTLFEFVIIQAFRRLYCARPGFDLRQIYHLNSRLISKPKPPVKNCYVTLRPRQRPPHISHGTLQNLSIFDKNTPFRGNAAIHVVKAAQLLCNVKSKWPKTDGLIQFLILLKPVHNQRRQVSIAFTMPITLPSSLRWITCFLQREANLYSAKRSFTLSMSRSWMGICLSTQVFDSLSVKPQHFFLPCLVIIHFTTTYVKQKTFQHLFGVNPHHKLSN